MRNSIDGPVLAFGAAGAGMNFQIGVVAVGLARQHGLQPQLLGALLQAPRPSFPHPPPWRRRLPPPPSRSGRWRRPVRFPALCTADSEVSSFWRSRISFCAAAGSFQRAGSSARAFSSSRRRSDLSQSKMPPQQGDGLLDVFDAALGFRAHKADIVCGGPVRKGLNQAAGVLLLGKGPMENRSRWPSSAERMRSSSAE